MEFAEIIPQWQICKKISNFNLQKKSWERQFPKNVAGILSLVEMLMIGWYFEDYIPGRDSEDETCSRFV